MQGKSDSFKSTNQDDQYSTTSQTSPKRSKKRCPCEEHPNAGYHYFSDCYYINDSIKPSNWTPNPKAIEQLEKACKNELFKKAYDIVKEKYSSNLTSNDLKITMMTLHSQENEPGFYFKKYLVL